MKSTTISNHIIIDKYTLNQIVENWTNYLIKNPKKLFKLNHSFKSYTNCIDQIKKHDGFQITAFAGKVQNKYTHPERLPDLGELNLLARLRAIQLLVKKPIRIILDGHYYAETFGEKKKYIYKYNSILDKLSNITQLNREYKKFKTFLTVNQLIKNLKLKKDYIARKLRYYKDNPKKAYEDIELYPKDMLSSVRRMISSNLQQEFNTRKELENFLLKIGSNFIIHKAALSAIIDLSKDKNNYQRITILKYSKTNNPRINLEMNIAPWNSTILFKNSYININTASNGAYETYLKDKQNYIIKDKNDYFWGFSRNKNIFQ